MRELDSIIADIEEREQAVAVAAADIKDTAQDIEFVEGRAVETDLVHSVNPAALDSRTLAGIDGGLARNALHGIDVIMVRAVAAVFDYTDGSLDEHRYVPEPRPMPDVSFTDDRIDRTGADRLASLQRLQAEIGAALQTLEQDDIDTLLLDGSIVPQYRDKPATDSPLRDTYDAVIEQYRELYRTASEQDVLLAGVVEDTRSANLCTVLQENGIELDALDRCRDSHLLNYLLETGERTLAMQYAANEHHPIITDLEGYGDHIYSSYLKSVENDRPIRFDVFAPEHVADRMQQAASIISAVSAGNAGYGIPAILVEADRRAGLDPHEIDRVMDRIRSRTSHLNGTQDLRRDRRPF